MLIYKGTHAEKPFMGLKTFSGDFPVKKDISIAKNYLDEKELKVLNNIVSGYFDFAEIIVWEVSVLLDNDGNLIEVGTPV